MTSGGFWAPVSYITLEITLQYLGDYITLH